MCYSIGLRELDQSDSGIKLYPMFKRVERKETNPLEK